MIIEDILKEDNFSFTENTTYRCGGNARVAYFPETEEQAVAVYDYVADNKIDFVTLGNGSNVLASDKFFDGAVISTKNFTGIKRTDRGTIVCLAGTTVGSILSFCITNGFGGLEYLAGIPATIGGLAYMNGGADEKYIERNVVNVRLYDGKISELSNKNCHFGHKYSTMRDINGLILSVELKITQKSSEEIIDDIKRRVRQRGSLPTGASCGCVFKNPNNTSAGKLIDEAGLKGLKLGGAAVSERHANFIINYGNRASDVRKLIEEVRRKVFERTGIFLEEEVIYIGDF